MSWEIGAIGWVDQLRVEIKFLPEPFWWRAAAHLISSCLIAGLPKWPGIQCDSGSLYIATTPLSQSLAGRQLHMAAIIINKTQRRKHSLGMQYRLTVIRAQYSCQHPSIAVLVCRSLFYVWEAHGCWQLPRSVHLFLVRPWFPPTSFHNHWNKYISSRACLLIPFM